jgi:hypothetical protein
LIVILEELRQANSWTELLYKKIKKNTARRLGKIEKDKNGKLDFAKAKAKVQKHKNYGDFKAAKEEDQNFSLSQLVNFANPALWTEVWKIELDPWTWYGQHRAEQDVINGKPAWFKTIADYFQINNQV